jgi:hypothetical protein
VATANTIRRRLNRRLPASYRPPIEETPAGACTPVNLARQQMVAVGPEPRHRSAEFVLATGCADRKYVPRRGYGKEFATEPVVSSTQIVKRLPRRDKCPISRNGKAKVQPMDDIVISRPVAGHVGREIFRKTRLRPGAHAL